MKRLFYFLIILIAAVWLGLILKANPGYMLFTFGNWSMEMPLWFGILMFFLTLVIFYWILRLIAYGMNIPARMRFWRSQHAIQHARSETNKGLIALTEGNWVKAEKLLRKAAGITDTPLINYLASARAAQEQGVYERRDEYLRDAHRVNPEAAIAIELTQARLQLDHRQLEQALATLRHLRELAPHHKTVLKLLKQLYIELKDWKSLQELLPELTKYHVIETAESETLELVVYENLLEQNIQHGKEDTDHFFKRVLPRKWQNDSLLIEHYCQYLIDKNDFKNAEYLLRHALKKEWDENLIKLYGEFIDDHGQKQLAHAESWLKVYKNDAMLLLTCGRLCLANQLWGKAKNYLEMSVNVKPMSENLVELAKLLEELGDKTEALDCYRRASES